MVATPYNNHASDFGECYLLKAFCRFLRCPEFDHCCACACVYVCVCEYMCARENVCCMR